MFSSGAAAVPSSACLRCQLRCVLQHLRCPPLTPRRQLVPRQHFSTIHRQQAVRDDGVYYKHITPGGRIVGKPGRKQRQTSEALAISSLGEKSEIVIFRDVIEDRRNKIAKSKESKDVDFGEEGLKGLSLTSEEIQAALSETDLPLDEQDVNDSIDALRPQAPVVEKQEYDRLIKELLDCYNVRQLSRYLRRSVASKQPLLVVRKLQYQAPGSSMKRSIAFTRSRWQPGRTPLDKRRTSEFSSPQGASLPPKARTAERIVRVAWQVAVDVEEQEVGELEMQMMPWQTSMFFDLIANKRPKYESVIQPPLLLRNATVRPYRRDGIVRITARRKDAEDIASQLENKVLEIGKLLLDINPLIPQHGKKEAAVRSWKNFRKEDLDMISQRTQSVLLKQDDGKIGIYSFRMPDRYVARRLLLNTLDLSSRGVVSTTLLTEGDEDVHQPESAQGPLALVPVFAEKALHFRDRPKSLARAIVPVQRKAEGVAAPAIKPAKSTQTRADSMSRALAPLVQQHEEQGRQGKSSVSPYWGSLQYATMLTTKKQWNVQLGQLLQEVKPGSEGDLFKKGQHSTRSIEKGTEDHVFLRNVPGWETLLSYFTPTKRLRQLKDDPNYTGKQGSELVYPVEVAEKVARSSILVAHFIPSPFTPRGSDALLHFPRFELTFSRNWGSKDASKELQVVSLRAIINEEFVHIPLPDQAIDLRLHRQASLQAPKKSLAADKGIAEFASRLNKSAQASSSLYGMTDMMFEIPSWMEEAKTGVDSLTEAGKLHHGKKADAPGQLDTPVPYLFDRFEQTQTTTFLPNTEALSERALHNSTIEQFKNSLPEGMFVRYKEVEAGAIGGSQTDVSIGFHAPPDTALRTAPTTGEAELQRNKEALNHVLKPSLAVADLMTKACKNEILAWRPRRLATESDALPWQQVEYETRVDTQGPEEGEVQGQNESSQQPEDVSPADAVKSEMSDRNQAHEHVQQPENETQSDAQEAEESKTLSTPELVQQEDANVEESENIKAEPKA